MKRTPLYDAHVARGAKMVDFAGWEMPVHYTGVLDEYYAVRRQAGLFDVSHMGRINVRGRDALPFLQQVTTNDVAAIDVGRSQYSMVCNAEGGVKDDIFIYRTGPEEFLLCVNASNREKIMTWLMEQHDKVSGKHDIQDCSEEVAQMALQGPTSKSILMELVDKEVEQLKPRGCFQTKVGNDSWLISRTGYSGELGYELYGPSHGALEMWSILMRGAATYGIKPAGLGARDLLRLDMGYFLYGNDLTEETTPLEAGAEWIVSFTKGEFIGRAMMIRQKEEGLLRKFIAFELLEKAIPRQGMKIYSGEQEAGQVTSGNLSPILQKGIGLGYVLPAFAEMGASLLVEIRGRRVPASVVKLPFYKKPKS